MDINRRLSNAVLLLAIGKLCNAAETVVPALDHTTVQTYITAAAEGDTLLLPAGSAVWTVQVLLDNKALTIRGAGTNLTHITHGLTTATPCLRVQKLNAKFVRVTGIHWDCLAHSPTTSGIIAIGSGAGSAYTIPNSNWRFDNLLFSGDWSRGINVNGLSEGGLIDHCRFVHLQDHTQQAITVWGGSKYVLVPGNTSASFPAGTAWAVAPTMGTAQMVFVEDCTIDYRYPGDAGLEGYYGARYVFRFNELINAAVGNHGLDSGVNSTHSFEIYGNTQISTDYPGSGNGSGFLGKNFEARGGTGLFASNRLSVPWLSGPNAGSFGGFEFWLEVYRATGESITKTSQGGKITGTNPYDGNQTGTVAASGVTPTGWPAQQSIGTTGPITLQATNALMTVLPVYLWGNTHGVDLANQTGSFEVRVGPPYNSVRDSGSDLVIDASNNLKVTSATHTFQNLPATNQRLQNDVNSWLNISSGIGFTPGWYKILDATNGAAILHASPGTVSSTGGVWQEEWAAIKPVDIIQVNRDYVLTNKPGWTPYTYPHPLQSGDTPPADPTPAAPSNMQVALISSTQLNLSWTDNATNELGFRIERSLTSGSGYFEIGLVSSNVVSFQNTSLQAATTYYYRVRAYNAAGASAFTAEGAGTTATTDPPVTALPARGRRGGLIPTGL